MPEINPVDEILEEQPRSGDKEFSDKPLDYKRRVMSFNEERWFYYVRVFFLLMSSICSAAIAIVFLFHITAPERFRWLNSNELERIRELALTIIVGLVMSGSTTYFFKKK
ncbi:MAG: hypothetical protein LBT23_06470 [Synergistaceae bacterium]|jgi:hypothetical protein|nr:hypothetical protein [Synergistaceae bacterium]